jgi:hypothetical protein
MKIFLQGVAALILIGVSSSSMAEITYVSASYVLGTPRQTGATLDTMLYEATGTAISETWFPSTMTFALGFTVTCSWVNSVYEHQQPFSQFYGGATTGTVNHISATISQQYPIPWTAGTPRGTCQHWCNQTYKGIATDASPVSFTGGYQGSGITFAPVPHEQTTIATTSFELCRTSQGAGGCIE